MVDCRCTERPPSPYPISYGFRCEVCGKEFWAYDREDAKATCTTHLKSHSECVTPPPDGEPIYYECTRTATCPTCGHQTVALVYSTVSYPDACMKAQDEANTKLEAHTCPEGPPSKPCLIAFILGGSLLAPKLFPLLRLFRDSHLPQLAVKLYYEFSAWILGGL